MSWQPAEDPKCTEQAGGSALVVESKVKDLGGFTVRRLLPSAKRQMVGPFIFLDEMGPATFPPGEGIDVRPHPHIGLATVTYLFEGEILHRDSLGYVQPIQPGALNWMTAGRGIVHSERSSPTERARTSALHGMQAWVALPPEHESADPGFAHYPAEDLPVVQREGISMRLICGDAYGLRSPAHTFWPLFYLDAQLDEGTSVPLPDAHEERAVYVVQGRVGVGGGSFGPGNLVVFQPGRKTVVDAIRKSRIMLLGGKPLPGEHYIWWNFVSTSQDVIERAKQKWRDGLFAEVPGETDFIPLPE